MPPPRNSPRSEPVILPIADPGETISVSAAPVADVPVPTLPQNTPPKSVEAPSFDGQEDLAKYSVYFDDTTDEFLESVRVAGRKIKPKIAASRSAVVRLALTKLAEQLTPEQVAAELARRAPEHTKTGRQRL
jgi:hypothetical protein